MMCVCVCIHSQIFTKDCIVYVLFFSSSFAQRAFVTTDSQHWPLHGGCMEVVLTVRNSGLSTLPLTFSTTGSLMIRSGQDLDFKLYFS